MEKPNILILGGVHGNEKSAIRCVEELVYDFKLKYPDKYPNIHVIPHTNLQAVFNGTRESFDRDSNGDLNRAFHTMKNFNETVEILESYLEMADVIIDVHNSPNCSHFALLDLQQTHIGNIIEWCKLSGVDVGCRYTTSSTIKNYCDFHDKMAITYEFKGMEYDRMAIDEAKRDIHALIKTLDKMPYNIPTKIDVTKIPEMLNIKTPVEGSISQIGDNPFHISYKKGDPIANVMVEFQNSSKSKLITAPCDGSIISIENKYCRAGETIILFQPDF